MDSATRRRRRALFLLFWLPGLMMASWVTRTPAIRDQLHASTAEMGLVLFGMSVGSMIGILNSGHLVRRFGTRSIITLGAIASIIGVVTIGLGAAFGATAVVFAGLMAFGTGTGVSEIAMNVEGAEIERITGGSVLPALHGYFSLGTVVGAALGIGLSVMNFSVTAHLLVVALVCVPALVAVQGIPAGYGRRSAPILKSRPNPRRRWVASVADRRLFLICVVVLAMALAEGAATDWLPLLMVDEHGFDPAVGSVVYAAFAVSMAVGRFSGSAMLARFRRESVVRGSAVLASAGLAVVVFSPSALSAAIAVVLWGLGASLGFPTALSAAGEGHGDRSRQVVFVATVGYTAFLVGPPLLGFLGDHVGLRGAMVAVLALLALAALSAPAVRSVSAHGGDGQQGAKGTAAFTQ